MRIPLDRQNHIPLYRQIETFLRQGILSGSFPPGSRLPAIRHLARDLGVSRITVEGAYAELEAAGLVLSRVGSGTYVLAASQPPPLPADEPAPPWPLWQQDLLARNRERFLGLVPDPALSADPATTEQPEAKFPHLISFAPGSGDPNLFPVQDLRKTIQAVMRHDGVSTLKYGDPKGCPSLRNTIVQMLGSQGVRTHPENVLVTGGSQQALALIVQLLVRPGDAVLLEVPTYSMVLHMLRAFNHRVVGIPVDEGGMQVEGLEKLLQQHHPRLIYTIPTFHNPTGTCLSDQRRTQLITLADRYNVPILEDDFVGDFRYEGRTQPTLKALDPGGRVIHVGTFSKMLMPGLRIGFIVAEGPICDLLLQWKHFNDLASSNLIQRALDAFVTVGRYQAHLRRISAIYRKRRDAMLRAIWRYMPAGVSADRPPGGLFVWLHLPPGISSDALLSLAREEGVTFVPGSRFFLEPSDGGAYLRLNFAAQPPAVIEEGIRRLSRAIRRM